MSRAKTLIEAAAAGVGTAASGGLLRPVGPATAWRMARAGLRHRFAASALLGLAAAQWPDRDCIVDDTGTTSYAEVYRRVERLAGALRQRDASQGSRVGVMCRNHVGFVVASFAALWADADLVLLNTDFGGAQLGDVLRREGLDLLIHDSEFTSTVLAAASTTPAIVADAGGDDSIDTLVSEERHAPRGGGRHGRVVILTSGTTGTPKGSQREPDLFGALAPVSSLIRGIGLRSGDVVCILPPLFHGFGLAYLLTAMSFGCPVVITRRFDADEVLARIERDRVRIVFAVPVMLSRLLDAAAKKRADTTSLRAVQSGAAPLSPALAERFMDEFGDVLHDVYGSTESGWCTLAGPADLRDAPGTVGRPLRGVSVRILGPDGLSMPRGQVGEVFVDSGMIAPTYTGGGGKRVVDGHVSTGDLGHVDRQGRLFIDGREDDMIVSGGENVFPGEVADVIGTHPDVVEVDVHGVDDDVFGSRLRALVVRRVGADVSAEDVRALVKERLARYKVPRDVEFVEALDRTATGKVKRVR